LLFVCRPVVNISCISMLRTSSTIQKKTIQKWGRNGSIGAMTFHCDMKSIESWVGTSQLSLLWRCFLFCFSVCFSVCLVCLVFFCWAWHPPNTLPTMHHNQTFRIIAWKPPLPNREDIAYPSSKTTLDFGSSVCPAMETVSNTW
jgi:hypothetical protein